MKVLLKDYNIINEGHSFIGGVLITDDTIEEIFDVTKTPDYENIIASLEKNCDLVLCGIDKNTQPEGHELLIPGVIDDQVHFREPGATQKGSINSDSLSAIRGGVTSFMDMPNNNPPICTLEALEDKYAIAARDSYINYSFYLGADNANISEIEKLDPHTVCGVKVFMGSSTGNMLVNDPEALQKIFACKNILIATHCEDEATIRQNLEKAKETYGEHIPFSEHPNIRSREACIKSTAKALETAIANNTRLHILHVSTAEEIEMICEAQKKNPLITFEVCVHYMWFDNSDYYRFGSYMKCNPAIKSSKDREAITAAVRDGLVGAVATDHAPHLLAEKNNDYLHAPSGIPTIQHSLQMMLELSEKGAFPIEQVIRTMCHLPADTFGIEGRGYIRKGYKADLVTVKKMQLTVSPSNITYRCGWSPLDGHTFHYDVTNAFINGVHTLRSGCFTGERHPMRLTFK